MQCGEGYAFCKIKSFSAERGYGVIEPDDGSADVFMHIGALHRTRADTIQGFLANLILSPVFAKWQADT